VGKSLRRVTGITDDNGIKNDCQEGDSNVSCRQEISEKQVREVRPSSATLRNRPDWSVHKEK